MSKLALISVFNKTGIVEFATKLSKYDYQFLSTGGTLKLLKKAGLPVIAVEEHTGFPEMMEGRVKTLHPKIHGGLLARRDKENHLTQARGNKIELIDLVCVNLYPFEETINQPECTKEDAIEKIDIGGPSILRSAAKNFASVTVVADPSDYTTVLKELAENQGQTTLNFRKKMAVKAFWTTSQYDSAISQYFDKQKKTFFMQEKQVLRYGENPHLKASLWKILKNKVPADIATAQILQGKAMSFLNFYDAEATLDMVRDFSEPTAVFVKHANPCGLASHKNIETAFINAYECDPRSAFGVIIAINKPFSEKLAQIILDRKIFVEIIIAPDFLPSALKILATKPNIRLLKVGELKKRNDFDLKKVGSGFLIQDFNNTVITKDDIKFVTDIRPTPTQLNDLIFAFQTVKHVKSNAIVLAKNQATIGIGAGQMSRVDSTEIAIRKAGDRAKGSVLASDAFFPFADSIEEAVRNGISAIIQPGGSIKDADVIAKANKLGIAMVFTGIRMFKH